MHLLQTNFSGDPNLGLYGFATDKYCFLNAKANVKVLKVKKKGGTLLNTDFLGLFSTGNSHGIVISEVAEEFEALSLPFETLVLKTYYTALGNLILMNDNGAILSPLLKKFTKEIKGFFGVPIEVMKIAGLNIVDSVGIATNKGCLLTPRVEKREINMIEDVLGVSADIGTVNFGSPFVGTGVIANSSGFIASKVSSGPEVHKMDETFGFLRT